MAGNPFSRATQTNIKNKRAGDEKIGNQTEAVVAQQCECTKCYWIVHFNTANYMFCEFYLDHKKNERTEL